MPDTAKLTETLEVNDWDTMAKDAKSAAYFVKTKGWPLVFGLLLLTVFGVIGSPNNALLIVASLLPTTFLLRLAILLSGNVLSFIGMYASSRSRAEANAALNKKP
jgi:hypothetical protein